MRSRETIAARHAPLRPLLAKELREIVAGRAMWILLLLMCPLIGYSFFQAVSLYAESSIAAQQSPVLAASLSPLDGVLVPTFGASYVAVTLLFPFVAIRVLGQEKESGTLRLLVQLPYRTSVLIAAKLAAILAGVFAAAVTDSTATAAIVALAFTIGSWVLDFTIAGRPGILDWLARLSLTQVLRGFEQGLSSAGLILGVIAAIGGFATLAGIWLPPGVAARVKLVRSIVCILATIVVLTLIAQIGFSRDVTEDRRNSFPAADARVLAKLSEPLRVSVHLAPEDPRFIDLQRNVLSKLARAMPDATIRLAAARQPIATGTGDESYGQIEFSYGARADVTRSTSPREILPLLYGLAQVPVPQPDPGGGYPGYPLVADARLTLPFFFGALPLLIALAWWLSRRPPQRVFAFSKETSK